MPAIGGVVRKRWGWHARCTSGNHMKKIVTLSLAAASTFASVVVLECNAYACGGCFVSGEDNTVVTDHRMVLSVSQQETTLYDQIRYQGSPAAFAWVLPIRGTVKVGISSDAVFSVLDSQTSVLVQQPPRNCPPPPNCGDRGGSSGGGFASAGQAADASAPPVTVLKEETVGPYETVQLRSTDPQALATWLTERGFNISPQVAPVINAYVAEQFDFLALKLVPGTSVRSMRPVRITAAGAGAGLPLRMVAAGTGAQVGIGLWIVGDGRWEAQNFASFTIKPEDLVWDWQTSSSNFKTVRAAKNAELGGSAWENETSVNVFRSSTEWQIRNGARGVDATDDYAAQKDENGTIVKTAEKVFDEDMDALFGPRRDRVRITRMRADLPQASLAADLQLQASVDQSELGRVRQVSKEANEPMCPVYNGCDVVGQAPRSEATSAQTQYGSRGCSTTGDGSGTSTAVLFAGIGALCAALVRARRKVTQA
jgi:hypothetical protein